MTQDELTLVFDALKQCNIFAYAGGLGVRATAHTDALAILEKALAQEQEPVACIVKGCINDKSQGRFVGDLCSPCHAFIATGKGNYSQAYRNTQRTWVGLTDEEVRDLWSWSATSEAEKTANTQQHAFARAIEAKLKEKNFV